MAINAVAKLLLLLYSAEAAGVFGRSGRWISLTSPATRPVASRNSFAWRTTRLSFVARSYHHHLQPRDWWSKLPKLHRVKPSRNFSRALKPSLITMRDHSATTGWFQIGDQVQVLATDLAAVSEGSIGTVVETWEKCDVDPTCCCAEQVDTNMAIRVYFSGTMRNSTQQDGFYYYFAEEELVKVANSLNTAG
jgi:hypothetical protein